MELIALNAILRVLTERNLVYRELSCQVTEAEAHAMSGKSYTPSNIDADHEAISGPEVLMEGRFRLYETPRGGYKLVYRLDSEEKDRPHIDIPAAMVKAAKAMGANGLKMFGMRG